MVRAFTRTVATSSSRRLSDAYRNLGSVHGRPTIDVRTPEWDPVGLEEGVKWIGTRIENGWFGYRFCANGNHVSVWCKHWEYGDAEPEFPPGACEGTT